MREQLAERGVESGIHYPVPLHLQPAYAKLGYAQGDFPVSESGRRAWSRCRCSPSTREQRAHVVASLAEAMAPTDPRGESA